MQKCENSIQSGPMVWSKDLYRVEHKKQIRPQNLYDERKKTYANQPPSQPFLRSQVVQREI